MKRNSSKPVSPTEHYNWNSMKKTTQQDEALKKLVSENHKRSSTDLTMTLSNSGVQIGSRTVY
jgi:Fe2+ or Zn2+ uptake regulation protein